MNISNMDDQAIKDLSFRADRIAELVIKEAAKGEEGIYQKELYPLVFAVVLENMLK